MTFIWQLENFPNFSFSTEKLLPNIQNFALQLGEANVMLSSFSQENKQEVFTEIMLSEAPALRSLQTSELINSQIQSKPHPLIN